MKKHINTIFILSSVISTSAFSMDYMEIGPWSGERNFSYTINSSSLNSNYGNPTSKLDFNDVKVGGAYIKFGSNDGLSYSNTRISIGTGYQNGEFKDDDWYSENYANNYGMSTKFSSTTSELNIGLDLSIEHAYGDYLAGHPIGFDKIGFGFKTSGSITTYSGYGLTNHVESYGFNEVEAKNYDKSVNVINITNYEVSSGFNIVGEKTLYPGTTFNFDVNLVPINLIQTLDDHVIRGEEFIYSSPRFGASAEVSITYKIQKNTGIKAFASGYSYQPYYEREIKVKGDSESGKTKLSDQSSNGYTIGVAFISNWQ